jgi:hypothetical protein
MRSAPQNRLLPAISLIKAIVWGGDLCLSPARLGFVFPEHAEEFTMEAEERLRLDKKEGLFPGPNHPGSEYQKELVCFPA